MKERGINPWVGPSDKASAEERAIIERARTQPIAYDSTSGGGAIKSFGGGGGTIQHLLVSVNQEEVSHKTLSA